MRKIGLGGSDCAAAVGLSRWKSPFQLWAEKTDRVVPAKAGEAAYWGSVMEPILRAEVAKRMPEAEVRECPFFLRSKEHPYMLANIDGYVRENGSFSCLEIKTANAFAAVQDWQSGLPIEYYCQVMHYMAVTGMASAYVAVLLGGNTFEIQKIDRDEDMIQHIIQMEERFWYEYLLKDTPPEATANDDEMIISISRTVHDIRKDKSIDGRSWIISPPKSENSRRKIMIKDKRCADHARYMCSFTNKTVIYDGQEYNFIFATKTGRPICKSTFIGNFVKIRKEIDSDIRIHEIRHSIATLMANNPAISYNNAAAFLGHSLNVFMNIYVHSNEDALNSCSNAISDAFKDSEPTKKT